MHAIHQNLPKISNLRSRELTNSFKQDVMDKPSVLSLWACRMHKLLRRICDMLVRRYVFTLRSTEALRSLIAFVAGITKISLSKVHTSDMQMRWTGDRLIM